MKKNKKRKTFTQPYETENLVRLRDAKFESLSDVLLSTMESLDSKARMSLFRKILLQFLEKHVSIAEILGEKRKSQDIIATFRSDDHVEINKDIQMSVSDILSLMGREPLFRPIISRFVCMYTVFAVSDKEGSTKCKNLAKDLLRSKNNTPERLVLSVLKQRALRIGESIPSEEHELIEKYSFWNRKMESWIYDSIFLYKKIFSLDF